MTFQSREADSKYRELWLQLNTHSITDQLRRAPPLSAPAQLRAHLTEWSGLPYRYDLLHMTLKPPHNAFGLEVED